MTLLCRHVRRLELQKFFNCCAAQLPVKREIETKFPYFFFWTCIGKCLVFVWKQCSDIASPAAKCNDKYYYIISRINRHCICVIIKPKLIYNLLDDNLDE